MLKELNKQKLQTVLFRHGPKTLKHFGNIIRDSLLGNTALVLFFVTGGIKALTPILYFIWILTIQLVLYFSLNNFLHSLHAIH